jgi:hypothetical protein
MGAYYFHPAMVVEGGDRKLRAGSTSLERERSGAAAAGNCRCPLLPAGALLRRMDEAAASNGRVCTSEQRPRSPPARPMAELHISRIMVTQNGCLCVIAA